MPVRGILSQSETVSQNSIPGYFQKLRDSKISIDGLACVLLFNCNLYCSVGDFLASLNTCYGKYTSLCASILTRRWRYINHLLTYLLT